MEPTIYSEKCFPHTMFVNDDTVSRAYEFMLLNRI